MKRDSMAKKNWTPGQIELMGELEGARKLFPNDTGKSVKDGMFYYERILLKAYNRKLEINPLETPGGMISDLQNAGYLIDGNYKALTKTGKQYVERELLGKQ